MHLLFHFTITINVYVNPHIYSPAVRNLSVTYILHQIAD